MLKETKKFDKERDLTKLRPAILNDDSDDFIAIFLPLPAGTDLTPFLQIFDNFDIVDLNYRVYPEDPEIPKYPGWNKINHNAVRTPIPGTNPVRCNTQTTVMPEGALGIAFHINK